MSHASEDQAIDWQEEAEAVIRDVGFALKSISISSQMPQSSTEIYFNIETREGQKLCVELSSYGFRVVSDCFDDAKEGFPDQTYYETPYALFDKYSSQFRHCFANELEKKLSRLTGFS
ncbi:GSK3-beta interaction protein-like [Uloborus diversus]|uniref:GSK3-beta interaction protein-like n=1 Tax=Uloborus diversus TaxID=327109 RepID=UPI0024097783|nr:GSK3-beta interaction protein-like [Uloborus diversus]